MEHLILNSIIQASTAAPADVSSACSCWDWLFWIGFFAGLIGGVVSFFKRPIEMG